MRMSSSYRVVEMVRAHISTPYVRASDTDVSRALGVTRAAISDYKHGRARMSAETAARALELLGDASREAAPLLKELQDEYQPNEPQQAIWRLLMSAASKAACVGVLAIVAAGANIAAPGNTAFAADSSVAHDIHYAKSRRRRRSRSVTPAAWLRWLFATPITQPSFA